MFANDSLRKSGGATAGRRVVWRTLSRVSPPLALAFTFAPRAHPLATARKPRTWHRKVAFSRTGRRDGSRQASKCGLPIGLPLPPARLWQESAHRPHSEHALEEVESTARSLSIA